jgi:hypothetical protein
MNMVTSLVRRTRFTTRLRTSASAILVAAIAVVSAHAQSAIPAARSVDWTHAGIPGGIPSANWPIYKTISPSGTADDSVAIQNAINAAPAGSVVVLTAGTFKLHRSSVVCQGKSDDFGSGVYEAGLCLTDKSVVLRGAGPDQTMLQYGDGASIISMGRTYTSSSNVTFVNITSSASKGATQITLASVSGISTGKYLVVTQHNVNDPADGTPLVNNVGYADSCSYCGHDLPNNSQTQIDRVTAVSGNTVTLERPLYFDYTNTPQVFALSLVESVGLENLRVSSTASSGTGLQYKNVNLESCAHCWVHNVQSDWAVDKSHIYMSDTYGCEISNNYVHDGYNHNTGSLYAILLEFRNSENLIQNNIEVRGRHGLIMTGSSGNVLAYNYLLDDYMGEYHNSLPESTTHGAHPYMNLWEGNVMGNVEFDNAHGSSSHNTLFRNYVSLINNNPDTGSPMTGALFAVNIAYDDNYMNILGNVIGPWGSKCTAGTYEENYSASQNAAIYKLGYYDDGGGSAPNASLAAKVGKTILRGGNWDCVSNSVIWSSNVPSGSLASTYIAQQTLPASLYLSAKPDWFSSSGAAWPPIDTAASTKMNKIPAQLCYENGPKSGGSFNPTTCYSAAGGPAPPTNLTIVIN